MNKFYLSVFTLLSCLFTNAQVTSVTSGNWNSGSTWSTGTVPTSTSQVVIASGHTVILNGTDMAATLTIHNGGTLLGPESSSLAITDSVINEGTINASGATITVGGAATTGLTNTGAFNLAGGTFTIGPPGGGNRQLRNMNGGTINVSNGILNINGNLLNTETAGFMQGGGNINIDGNAAGVAANSVAAGTPIAEFLNPSDKITLTGGTFTIVDPHVSGAANSYVLHVDNPAVIPVNGNFNHTLRFGNGISTDPGGNLEGFTLSFTGNTSSRIQPRNMVVEGPAGTNRLVTYAAPLTITGNLAINNGGDLRQTGSLSLYGNLTVNSGGSLTVSSLGFESQDSVQNVTINGTVRNSVTSPTASVTNLHLGKGADKAVNFNSDFSVSSFISFQGGYINMNGHTLTLGVSPADMGQIGNVQGYVIGKFKQYINTTLRGYTFPLGLTDGRKYASIDFYTAAPTAGGSLTAEWVPIYGGINGLPLTEGSMVIDSTSRSGFWRITAGDGLTGGVYKASLFGGAVAGYTDVTKVVMLKRANAGAPWTLNGTHVTSTPNAQGVTLTRENMSGFSEFGIGISTQTALPVRLLSFNGKVNAGGSVSVDWTVTQQQGIDRYIVERSGDGVAYTPIGTVTANNLRDYSYSFTDASPLNGKSYYRLAIIEAGRTTYSTVVVIAAGRGGLWVYPVPAKNVVTVERSSNAGKAQATITNMQGKVMMNVVLGQPVQEINISSLPAGTYVLRTADGTVTIMKQ